MEMAIRTVASAFEDAALFYGHGTDNALDEASWLVLHAMGLSPAEAPDYARQLTETDRQQTHSLMTRRIEQRVPLAYLTGTAWFAGLEFESDARALVPRSPLAEFIQHDFLELLDHQKAPRILDLCTGGGCIAIACAMQRPLAQVVGSDLSPEALDLAACNVARHSLQSRVALVEGSLFEPVMGRFDLIISNPPYVDESDLSDMPGEFHHEPRLGLAAGDDGLDLVRDILHGAAEHLEQDGILVVEVGNSGLALQEAFPDLALQWLDFDHGGSGVFMIQRDALAI